MNENDEVKELRKFAALARKKNRDQSFVTRIIYAENIDDATLWFGENNYEVDGHVYAIHLPEPVIEPVIENITPIIVPEPVIEPVIENVTPIIVPEPVIEPVVENITPIIVPEPVVEPVVENVTPIIVP